MLFDYNDEDVQSILNYAKKLEGKTFKDIKIAYDNSNVKSYEMAKSLSNLSNKVLSDNANQNAKGQLGNFLERFYFGHEPNGVQEADFSKVGVELKQTCVDKRKDGSLTAGERLSITNISFNEPVEEDFYKSHVWNKIRLILLIHYLRDRNIDRMDYKILFANLFTPPEKDLKIIIEDYNKINEKIKSGKAHELSESDTLYLGACTKGTNAKDSLRKQFYGDHTLAKKRNFCFKRQYMDYVLNHYILTNEVPCESITNNLSSSITDNLTFEEIITNTIKNYVGKTDKELCKEFNIKYTGNKAQWSVLAYRMLGIKSNKAEEFEKANIVVRTIRIEENGKNKENIPLPPIKFKELAKETWETSSFREYLDTTKFFFVIFQKDGDEFKLAGSKLWNIPYNDLNTIAKQGWENIQNVIKSGVIIKPELRGDKIIYTNNLPKKTDNQVMHIRPHAAESAYKFLNGQIVGDLSNADELPDGKWMTIQSFWLNNDYILDQLSK